MIGDRFPAVLKSAQEGAGWAFSVLYRDLNGPLLHYVAARLGAEGEDAASETWLLVAGAIGGFRGDELAFRAWVFTIARRRVIQHWRAAQRRPLRAGGWEAMVQCPATTDIECDVLAARAREELTALIERVLTPDQAKVLVLRVLADLDVGRVATVLGKRPGTVRVLQHKALRRLECLLAPGPLTK